MMLLILRIGMQYLVATITWPYDALVRSSTLAVKGFGPHATAIMNTNFYGLTVFLI